MTMPSANTNRSKIERKSGVRPTLTLIDLFAGCGGLSLGFEQAGFRTLAFCEVSESAARTYIANRRGVEPERFGDIREMTGVVLKGLKDRVDVIVGGPPCQGYSGIGHRRTFRIPKEGIPSNRLYKEMIRVIEGIQPRAFLFENVRGLLSGRWTPDGGKPGEIFSDVLSAFMKIAGYVVRWDIVHAYDHGVPQNRPRLFVVGVKESVLESAGVTVTSASKDGRFKIERSAVRDRLLPAPSRAPAPDLVDVLGDIARALPGIVSRYPVKPKSSTQEELRKGAPKGAEFTDHEHTAHSERVVRKFMAMRNANGIIPEGMRTKKFAQRLLPGTWGGARPTITVTSLPDDFVHFSEDRILTVREWARLQTFPDDYKFEGPRTTGGRRRAGDPSINDWSREVPRYTQIGNAVPVRLARAIAGHLAGILRAGPCT